MNPQPFARPPRWWSPKLSPFWIRFWRPFRRRMQQREQRLLEVDIRGAETLRRELDQGHGVLLTPNHSAHADAYCLYELAEQAGCLFYFMAAWQVLGNVSWIRCQILRQHGVFSVDREGTDLRAFRQAVEILQARPHPLVIFPEGEVYHVNERVTPFREGTAAIALSAAKKADRPIVIVPCAIKYSYIDDPTKELEEVMSRLEREIFWRPRPDLPLRERIYRFAEGALALKELEYCGATSAGDLPERIARLTETILQRIETRYGLRPRNPAVPERIKAARQHAIKTLSELDPDDDERSTYEVDLDDLFLVVQLFSYPGNYVDERPTIERMAETIDKFEEDVLRVPTATIRGSRRAVVMLGEPIPVAGKDRSKGASRELTRQLESRVQEMLDELH